MELIISRLAQHHLGLKVSIKEGETIGHVAIINGNNPDFLGPVILLNIDQHVVYGLSLPEVISRILVKGPQYLLSTKELAHNLFEHGMKSSVGKIKIHMNYFITSLETFYTVTTKASNVTLVTSKDNQLGFLIQPRTDLRPILVSNYPFLAKESDKELLNEVSTSIEIDTIKTHTITEFKYYGHTAPE